MLHVLFLILVIYILSLFLISLFDDQKFTNFIDLLKETAFGLIGFSSSQFSVPLASTMVFNFSSSTYFDFDLLFLLSC